MQTLTVIKFLDGDNVGNLLRVFNFLDESGFFEFVNFSLNDFP